MCRHGNRIDFINRKWTGEHPYLSEDGVVQAKETAERLKHENIKHIFTSPFLRTIQTAYYISLALDLPIKIENGASEWMNSEWFPQRPKPVPNKLLTELFPTIDTNYSSILTPSYPEDSETALVRAGNVVKSLSLQYEEDILIIGHGHSIWGMARGFLGDDFVMTTKLCSLTKIVRVNENITLELNNDTSHLSSGGMLGLM